MRKALAAMKHEIVSICDSSVLMLAAMRLRNSTLREDDCVDSCRQRRRTRMMLMGAGAVVVLGAVALIFFDKLTGLQQSFLPATQASTHLLVSFTLPVS